MSVVDFGDTDLNLFVSLLTLGDTFNKQMAEDLTAFKTMLEHKNIVCGRSSIEQKKYLSI